MYPLGVREGRSNLQILNLSLFRAGVFVVDTTDGDRQFADSLDFGVNTKGKLQNMRVGTFKHDFKQNGNKYISFWKN